MRTTRVVRGEPGTARQRRVRIDPKVIILRGQDGEVGAQVSDLLKYAVDAPCEQGCFFAA